MYPFNQFFASALWVVAASVLIPKSKGLVGGLLVLAISLFPHFITHSLIFIFNSKKSQIVLGISQIVFALWASFVYLDAFHWHPDPQSPIALVFIGIYASPVLLALWVLAKHLHIPQQNLTKG